MALSDSDILDSARAAGILMLARIGWGQPGFATLWSLSEDEMDAICKELIGTENPLLKKLLEQMGHALLIDESEIKR